MQMLMMGVRRWVYESFWSAMAAPPWRGGTERSVGEQAHAITSRGCLPCDITGVITLQRTAW